MFSITEMRMRLIAATHRDLEAAVECGTFREDLYYRLRRAVLEVPPLRARREDIPLLVEHVRSEVNQRYGIAIAGLSPQALAVLARTPWRGNIRELEAVVEQAMILRGEGWLGPENLDLPPPRGAVVAGGPRGPGALTWFQEEALRIAAGGHGVRRRDLMARCGISRETARRELSRLARAGELTRVGRGRGARYVIARLAP